MHPLQCHLLVKKSQVLRIRIVLAVRQVRQMEEAHDAESVGYGHHDDIGILLNEIGTVKQVHARSAAYKGSAVNPYHDWFLFSRCILCLPYIQIQAVLTHRGNDSLSLARTFCIFVGLIHTVVRSIFHWCFPAQVAYGLLTHKRDTLIGNDIVGLFAYEGSVYALYCQLIVGCFAPRLYRSWGVIIVRRTSREYTRAADKDGGKHPFFHFSHFTIIFVFD